MSKIVNDIQNLHFFNTCRATVPITVAFFFSILVVRLCPVISIIAALTRTFAISEMSMSRSRTTVLVISSWGRDISSLLYIRIYSSFLRFPFPPFFLFSRGHIFSCPFTFIFLFDLVGSLMFPIFSENLTFLVLGTMVFPAGRLARIASFFISAWDQLSMLRV